VPTVQSEQLPDFTASDILSPKLWQPQASRPPLGIDIACTKVAVDFQNLTADNADAVIRQNLDILIDSLLRAWGTHGASGELYTMKPQILRKVKRNSSSDFYQSTYASL